MSSLRHPSSLPDHRSPLGLSRLLVAASALAAGIYTTWVIWTALTLSTTAPFGLRLRLLLQESWSAVLVTFGLALATSRRLRLRQIGWVLVGIGVLSQCLWTWFLIMPHRIAVLHPSGHHVFHASDGASRSSTLLASMMLPVGDGPLGDAQRERLVDAAYRQYEAELFRFAIHYGQRLGADTMLAENTVQDTFAALLEGRDDAVWQRDASGFRAYLFTSIKKRLATMLRGEDRRAGHEAAAADDGAPRLALAQSPTAFHDGNELAERIQLGLRECPPRMAEAFHLVHEGGLSLTEAAVVMGISPKTVSAMLGKVAGSCPTCTISSRIREPGEISRPSKPVHAEPYCVPLRAGALHRRAHLDASVCRHRPWRQHTRPGNCLLPPGRYDPHCAHCGQPGARRIRDGGFGWALARAASAGRG